MISVMTDECGAPRDRTIRRVGKWARRRFGFGSFLGIPNHTLGGRNTLVANVGDGDDFPERQARGAFLLSLASELEDRFLRRAIKGNL